MKKMIFAAAMTAVFLSGCSLSAVSEDSSFYEAKSSFFAMDTYVTVTVNGEDPGTAEKSAQLAQEKIQFLEALWSVTDENSEVYRIDHSGGTAVNVSSETAELIRFGTEISAMTDGAFDITLYPILTEWGFTTGEYKIPEEGVIAELLKNTGWEKIAVHDRTVTVPEKMMIDLGGIGKGAAGDAAVSILKENGIASALLDLGGNIHAVGSKPDGSPWRIGIRDPFSEGNAGVLEASDRAVVTSGGYERYFCGEDGKIYSHILDPKSGHPAESGIASATVVGKEGRLCDSLSTSLFVMGSEKAESLWRGRDDFEMVLITNDGKIIFTEGLEDGFTPAADRTEIIMLKR